MKGESDMMNNTYTYMTATPSWFKAERYDYCDSAETIVEKESIFKLLLHSLLTLTF